MIVVGDCIEEMRKMGPDLVDAIVTDPPYGLGFMGKAWDDLPPGLEWAEECLRVLKPGGHLLAFGGTRTYHRLACAVEDAGFEIRDSLVWLYGSGFPKSVNLKNEWHGWGTALKPAHEPILLARKPLSERTVAANVLKWGTGALNVDGCRVAGKLDGDPHRFAKTDGGWAVTFSQNPLVVRSEGRWPANVVLDEKAAETLGDPSRFFYVAKASRRERNEGLEGFEERETFQKNTSKRIIRSNPDNGRHEEFEHTPLRHPNHHPTVKPVALMRWLVRLITPPDGLVLDSFAGSGTTGIACVLEGFRFLGIEREPEYVAIAVARIEHWSKGQMSLA